MPEKDTLGSLNDVDVQGALQGDVLKYDGVDWTYDKNFLDDLGDVNITKNLGEDGKYIKYDFLQNKFVLDTVNNFPETTDDGLNYVRYRDVGNPSGAW